jgi:pyrroline-5-carboxylate reductase
MSEYELGVIGAGNMGEALLRGVIRADFLPREQIVASDAAGERRELLKGDLGIECVEDNKIPAQSPRVVLSVKPQVMGEVLDGISSVVRPDALVITIAAGVKTSLLDEKFNGKGRLIRVMPNTPMLVGEGISAVAPGPRATEEDLQWTRQLFGASGQTVEVTEEMMDAVTAVSGSGPAYFFYLIEAMIAAGIADGLPPEVAQALVIQTCAGAAKLLIETGESPEVLRDRVTSPGGTTQRAMATLDAAAAKDILISAVRAATQRGKELGK